MIYEVKEKEKEKKKEKRATATTTAGLLQDVSHDDDSTKLNHATASVGTHALRSDGDDERD